MKFYYRPVVEKMRKMRAYPYPEPTESLRVAAVRALQLVEAAAKEYEESGTEQVVFIEVLPVPEVQHDDDKRRADAPGQLALFGGSTDSGGEDGDEGLSYGG
jgi:hypothetical protein